MSKFLGISIDAFTFVVFFFFFFPLFLKPPLIHYCNSFSSNRKIPPWRLIYIFRDIRRLCRTGGIIFTHIPQPENSVADFLAKVGVQKQRHAIELFWSRYSLGVWGNGDSLLYLRQLRGTVHIVFCTVFLCILSESRVELSYVWLYSICTYTYFNESIC